MQLKDFWQKELQEIQENKIRFAGLCICFIVLAGLFLADDGGGDEITLNETPTPEVIETANTNKNIVTVKNSAVPTADKNIKIVRGANSDGLFISDPFKIPEKEKIEPPPELPPVIIAPPVAQVPISNEKFILRGTAIIGANKSALVQKIFVDKKNSDAENLILNIGDSLNGKRVIDIGVDCLILDDGETLYIDIQSP